MKANTKYILAKPEVTYGVDPTPDGSDYILTTGLQRSPYEGNVVSRDLDRPALGSDSTINTGPYVMVEFAVELAGAGAAGDVPGYGVLLRACGFSETINASTSVVYEPVSTGFESCTIYYDRDGERQIIRGCRGSVAVEMGVGNYPRLRFRMVGLYTRPVAASAVVTSTAGYSAPLPVNKANTGTLTLGAYNVQLQSMTIDMAADTPHLDLVNFEEVLYVDRAPAGEFSFLAPRIATLDIMGLIESNSGTVTTSALSVVHGSTAGNIIEIGAPAVQLSGLSEIEIQGEQGYQSQALFIPDSGDDEVVLTIR